MLVWRLGLSPVALVNCRTHRIGTACMKARGAEGVKGSCDPVLKVTKSALIDSLLSFPEP